MEQNMHHTADHSTNVAKDAIEMQLGGISDVVSTVKTKPGPNKNCLFFNKVKEKQICMLTVWHISTGAKGNLTERSDYILANVLVTVISVLLGIYFLTYQTYVMRADVITSSILIAAYGVDGLVALSMLTRLVRSVPHSTQWKWLICVYYERFLVFFG